MITITIVSLISKILGNQTHLADSGVNASVWALIFGFVLANTVFWSYLELPKWIGCIQKYQEYYIKLGFIDKKINLKVNLLRFSVLSY